MAEILDLFGDPVPEHFGGRGRPPHIPTRENRNKVQMLLALGWNNDRIAKAISITANTLRKHYLRELKFRMDARDRMDARLAMMLWGECEKGNVAAMKEFQKLVDRNDLMAGHQSFYGTDLPRPAAAAAAVDEPKQERLGKKDLAAIAAKSAGEDTEWGDDLKPSVN